MYAIDICTHAVMSNHYHLVLRVDQRRAKAWPPMEGRFRSQALLDDPGLLTAMAYVDLNPIRAGIADTPEASDFTSISARIESLRHERQHKLKIKSDRIEVPLQGFRDTSPKFAPAIPCRLTDYIELVDWSGRSRRPGKRAALTRTFLPSSSA
jgi:hypothetical protein